MFEIIKGLVAKAWKNEKLDLEPGRHFVDEMMLVHVRGVVERGEDQMVAATVSIPLVPTLALLIEKCGVNGDEALRLLREAILEAVDNRSTKCRKIQERIANVNEAVSAVKRQLIEKLPRMHRTGRINLKGLEVEVVQESAELVETVA